MDVMTQAVASVGVRPPLGGIRKGKFYTLNRLQSPGINHLPFDGAQFERLSCQHRIIDIQDSPTPDIIGYTPTWGTFGGCPGFSIGFQEHFNEIDPAAQLRDGGDE